MREFREYWNELGFTQMICSTLTEEQNTTFNIADVCTDFFKEQENEVYKKAVLEVNRIIQSVQGTDTSKDTKHSLRMIEKAVLELIKDRDEKFFNDVVIQSE